MSTSDTPDLVFFKKTLSLYLFVSSFTALFGLVYEFFSNGVFSPFMAFAFVSPLFYGALPYAAATVLKLKKRSAGARYAHHSSVALLTLYSLLRGVFDIYGTSSEYLVWYLVCAVLSGLASASVFFAETASDRRGKEK